MKASLYSLFLIGLTGVLAAPAANADADNEIEARATCTITCSSGYFAEYNSKTKRCKCVKVNEEYCLRETVCIGTHYASWDAKTQTCSCQPYDFVAEEKCLREQICIGTHHAVWNSTTKQCSCQPYVFEDTEKDRCLLATDCIQGAHPFWNSSTRKCSCNPDNGEFICKAATTCLSGSVPVWNSLTETCNCKAVTKRDEDPIDYTTCPHIRCGSGTQPKYIASKKQCICEKIPVTTTKSIKPIPTNSPHPSTCPTIKCSAGYKPVYNPKTKTCSCQPDPTQCTDWFCIAEQRPVYDPVTGRCGCQWIPGLEPVPQDPCTDIWCIAEMTPKVNSTTGLCDCVWIPGLEPGEPTDVKRDSVEQRAAEPKAVAEPQRKPVKPTCTGIFCIAEQRPVYNATSGRCECEWIPGLEPGNPSESKRDEVEARNPEPEAVAEPQTRPIPHPACRGILCIAEKRPVYNATSGRCECEWIPGFGPVKLFEREAEADATSVSPTKPTPVDHCTLYRIWCEFGDHHMHFNPATKECECPVDQCTFLKIYCEGGDHRMHYNPKTKQCECPPLKSTPLPTPLKA